MANEPQFDLSLEKRLAELTPRKRALLERLLRARGGEDASGMVIPRRPPSGTAPLSYAQQRMWFLDRLYPGTAALNCDFAVRVQVSYNIPVLERTLNEVVRRHEILRTTFREEDGETVQVIAPFLQIPLPVIDLSPLAVTEREAEALRLSTLEARQPFDLTRGPLLRTKLLRLGEADYVLLITMHHIIADYSSMLVFFNEVKALYLAYSLGSPSPLPELPMQYADFAVWQREQFQGGLLQAQLEYWRRQLRDPARLRLPTDRPHAAEAIWEGARYLIGLPREFLSAVRQLGQRNDCTPFMTLLAAFQALLYRYTGQEDFAVGVPVANRTRPGTQLLIGFFVNSLVMRAHLSGDMTFRELLGRVRQTALEALSNQDVPFERLVEELHPERDASQHPLFQVSFQSLPVPASSPMASRMGIERGTATIDLAVEIEERPEAPLLRVEYSTSLFDEATIVRLAGHFRKLIESIVADPDQRISTLQILGDAERRQVLVDWNRTAADYPDDACLHTLVERQVARAPDAVALTCRNQNFTSRQLDRRANRLAHHLRDLGVGPEVLVGVCMERCPEMIVALLAVLKAGGAYVPLDPTYPRHRLRFMLEDARIPVLLTMRSLEQALPPSEARLVYLDEDWGGVAVESYCSPASGVSPNNLAYVMYTSGSTGRPKGVMVEHRAVVNQLCWMQRTFPLSTRDCMVQKYSFSFDISVWEIFGSLMAGARLVLIEPGRHTDAAYLVELMAREGVTVLDTVPSLVELLIEEGLARRCPSLRMLTCGGEVMPVGLLERLRQWPGLTINNMYGPTEATITATCWTDQGVGAAASVPIGRPVANTRIYILDRYLSPVPIGAAGELHIGGECLARGYLNCPDLTAERFIPDLFSDASGARLFRTGDLARYLPDGNIEFLGRTDQQVKVRGFRIELGEVEAALSCHPHVQSCAVLDQAASEGGTRLVAHVVPRQAEVEFWPSVGEYFVYDELLYYAMTSDQHRNAAYRQVIAAAVKGKTVLDIGTGADAIQARFCVEAGAERVYAIEMLDSACERARALVSRLGLDDKIVVIHGDSTMVTLPEQVDVCVSELIGTVGSSEGVIPILNDARRFLKDGGIMIPHRSITKIAAVSLPGTVAASPHFTELSGHYAQEVFRKIGYPFDVRVCVKNLPMSSVVSDADVFEDLQFTGPVPLGSRREIRLTIGRDCRLDGFLLWLNLYPGKDILLDIASEQSSWLPVFFPTFSPGIEVQQGDVIEAVCERFTEGDRWTPNYRLKGVVRRRSGETREFCWESFYSKPFFKQNLFYRALFSEPWGEGQRDGPSLDSSQRRVYLWRQEYETLYQQPPPHEDPTFNVIGWDSTFTGMPISFQEMHEQVEATVDRILSLEPKRVLEIGCGTGLLLFRLVPHLSRYVGTDFSRTALEYVRRHLPAADVPQVTLLERTADNFDGLDQGTFDLVVLNSVIQYFPNVEYLTGVLGGAARMVAPGGYIFIGDVRSLPLHEVFHTAVELYRADASVSSREAHERARRQMSQERELVIDPALFAALARRLPAARAEVMLKRGWRRNELSCFRYDVVLRIGVEAPAVDDTPAVKWHEVGSIEVLRRSLVETRPEVLLVTDVPNARVRAEVKALQLLADPEGPNTVQALRAALEGVEPGLEPEEFWALEKQLPYRVHITWSRSGMPDRFDAMLLREDQAPGRASVNLSAAGWIGERPLNSFTNDPVEQRFGQFLSSSLRTYLRSRLPEYMLPSLFVILDRLPLTPSGKVDRKALSASDRAHDGTSDVFVAPRTELERDIAVAWQEVLGIDQIGLYDNFFDLGGHSLLLVRLQTRLRQRLSTDISLVDLFRYPTVNALAGALSARSSPIQHHGNTIP